MLPPNRIYISFKNTYNTVNEIFYTEGRVTIGSPSYWGTSLIVKTDFLETASFYGGDQMYVSFFEERLFSHPFYDCWIRFLI